MAKFKVIVDDCIEVLTDKNFKLRFDLIVADAPFNIGHNYKGHDDNKTANEYTAFTTRWVKACWDKCDGVMCLHGPDDLAASFLRLEPWLGLTRIAWVIWHYRFGQCGRSNWINSHAHCLILRQRPEELHMEPGGGVS